jgi:hypothetical protein
VDLKLIPKPKKEPKTMNAKITVGMVVETVSPTGQPNAHTYRIGRGRVVDLHTETDGGIEAPFAGVAFLDGKRGSWPVDRLRPAK